MKRWTDIVSLGWMSGGGVGENEIILRRGGFGGDAQVGGRDTLGANA